jgi:hypothetical protein
LIVKYVDTCEAGNYNVTTLTKEKQMDSEDFERYKVENFSGTSELLIQADTIGDLKLINLVSYSGGFRWQHTMTLEQAKQAREYLTMSIESLGEQH